MTRRYFGTDGVRGIVGDDRSPDLVERVAKAATLWAGGGRVLVGRDTRASGPELEEAVAIGIAAGGGDAGAGGGGAGRAPGASGPGRDEAVAIGIASAGGTAVLGGVLPTPAVALLAQGLGVVISASHNPPEYNGAKLFHEGGQLVDEQEEQIEELL